MDSFTFFWVIRTKDILNKINYFISIFIFKNIFLIIVFLNASILLLTNSSFLDYLALASSRFFNKFNEDCMFLSCHEYTLYICLNVKELLGRKRRDLWSLSDCIWPNGWVFVYKLSSCGFESRCSHVAVILEIDE